MVRIALHGAGMVAVAWVVVAMLVFLFQGRLLYLPGLPGRTLDTTPDRYGMAYEEVEFGTPDGERLHGWWIPGEGPSVGAVLVFHGNAGNISHRLETIRIWRSLGRDVFIFDYRGYGRSTGRPSEAGTALDARAAWRHLVEERGAPPERIVLFGRSLGGAVATELAAALPTQRTPEALILESTFTSVPDLAAELYRWLPVRLLARIRYPTVDRLKSVEAPVLVIHSRDDEIIPFHHGIALYGVARPGRALLELRGGHNEGFLLAGPDYVEGIRAFLEGAATEEFRAPADPGDLPG